MTGASPPCRAPKRRLAWRAGLAGLIALSVMAPAAADTVPSGAASCSGCHAPATTAGLVPSLAGRPAEEIVAAMAAFRTGDRPATVMDRIAKGFSDEEIRAIAEWLAAGRDQAARSVQP